MIGFILGSVTKIIPDNNRDQEIIGVYDFFISDMSLIFWAFPSILSTFVTTNWSHKPKFLAVDTFDLNSYHIYLHRSQFGFHIGATRSGDFEVFPFHL